MRLNISNNQNNESANVQNAQVTNPTTAAIKVAKGSKPISAEEYTDFVEVKDEPKTAKKPKAEKKAVTLKRKVTFKKKTAEPVAANAQYNFVTYTTKKGGTAGYITGFTSDAEAKALADQLPHSINNTHRYNDKGEKVFVLSFGTRYVDAATALCHALNRGDQKDIHKYIADCHEVYNAAVAAGKAEREKWQQERKAEKAKAKADELAAIKKKNGLYSMEEIAAMMQRVLAGEDVPELAAVKEALKAA